jgi:hypothetical protein
MAFGRQRRAARISRDDPVGHARPIRAARKTPDAASGHGQRRAGAMAAGRRVRVRARAVDAVLGDRQQRERAVGDHCSAEHELGHGETDTGDADRADGGCSHTREPARHAVADRGSMGRVLACPAPLAVARVPDVRRGARHARPGPVHDPRQEQHGADTPVPPTTGVRDEGDDPGRHRRHDQCRDRAGADRRRDDGAADRRQARDREQRGIERRSSLGACLYVGPHVRSPPGVGPDIEDGRDAPDTTNRQGAGGRDLSCGARAGATRPRRATRSPATGSHRSRATPTPPARARRARPLHAPAGRWAALPAIARAEA